MNHLIALLFVADIVWQPVSCSVLVDKGNIEEKIVYYQRDENSILDELREHEIRNETERFQRDLKTSNNTESSIRAAYEKAMNQTVADYYAQRKAVMERYYARQREIIDKFGKKTTTESPSSTATIIDSRRNQTTEYTPTVMSTESTTLFSKSLNEREKNDSIVAWVNELTGADSRDVENGTTVNSQAQSSNTLASRVERKDIPGYYRLGEFRGSKDEKIVYQHNLGVGLKGSSQLEANFEVVLEGAFTITVIEAFPYANSRAHFSWISGGPGSNSVKLKLVGQENEGFSYTVKVWGVPKQT